MRHQKQKAILGIAIITVVSLAGCQKPSPTASPSASSSSSESQAPVARTPRADAQALVVQACDAYDNVYDKAKGKYGPYFSVSYDPDKFYRMIQPVWAPLAQAALEDSRWTETLTDLNFFFQVDSENISSGGTGLDAVYNSSEQARMGFFGACQIARSTSRVSLD